MANYAMTVNNQVIDILYNLTSPPSWPNTEDNIPVLAIECDDFTEIEMIYDGKIFRHKTEEELKEDFITSLKENIQNDLINNQDINFVISELSEIKKMILKDYQKIEEYATDKIVLELIENGIL